MKNIYIQILDLHPTFPSLVLATVIRSIGSTPQKPGSSALFGKSGLITGTVGGGILEAKVQEISKNAIESKDSFKATFSLNKDITDGENAICGGQISVLIGSDTYKHLSVYEEIKKSVNNKIPGVLITMISGITDNKVIIDRYWMTEKNKPGIQDRLLQKIEPEVKSILMKYDPSDFRELELSNQDNETSVLILLEPVFPPLSLVIAGAGHIGKALAHLGSLLDFEVTIIDDRAEFANKKNIPDAEFIIVENIGQALQKLKKSSDTYIVIVSRGHEDDAGALKVCIGSEAGYIGMIGSKNKVATMRRDFIDKGWATEQQWESVHTPVGIDINSRTVEEIALSIAAQLIQVKNGRLLRPAKRNSQ